MQPLTAGEGRRRNWITQSLTRVKLQNCRRGDCIKHHLTEVTLQQYMRGEEGRLYQLISFKGYRIRDKGQGIRDMG